MRVDYGPIGVSLMHMNKNELLRRCAAIGRALRLACAQDFAGEPPPHCPRHRGDWCLRAHEAALMARIAFDTRN